VEAAWCSRARRRARVCTLRGLGVSARGSVCMCRARVSQDKACVGSGHAATSSPRPGGSGAPVIHRSSLGRGLQAYTSSAKGGGKRANAHRGLEVASKAVQHGRRRGPAAGRRGAR
jgi:hypothetical protein